MSEKQLLIESCDFGFSCKISEEEKNTLTESLKISNGKNGNLIVRHIPCTILSRVNKNGRTYPTEIVQKAIEEAKPKMKSKSLLCSGDEHPVDVSFPKPSTISHCVIDAYIENVELEVDGKKQRYNVLFNDWEILNEKSPVASQLQQLILSGFNIGTSIRSLGSCDSNGVVTELEYLGTDVVGQPSSDTYIYMPINESVKVSTTPLNETYVVSASATNVVRDLDSALALQSEIDNAHFGTVKKTSTKVDSEVDPKTGAETTLITLETETEDEVSELDQALSMAKHAMLNGKADIDSITIENIKEEQPKESAENNEEPVLNEDDDADDYDKVNSVKCAWCGEELPKHEMKKEKDLGYICNRCAKSLESREGKLNFEENQNDPMYKALEKSNYYAFETPEEYMDFINKNQKLLGDYKLSEAEEIFKDYKDGNLDLALTRHKLEPFVGAIRINNLSNDVMDYVPESKIKESEDVDFITTMNALANDKNLSKEVFDDAMANNGNLEEGYSDAKYITGKSAGKNVDKIYDYVVALMWNEGLTLEQACRKFCEKHENIPYPYILEYMRPAIKSKMNVESVITEAKEEDPNTGRKFVLKCPAGFVAMDGNALVFKNNPKKALHFIVGKEESGLVHLSGVEKILDTMGVYDVEKYYRKNTTDISAPEDNNSAEVKEEQKEGLISDSGGVINTQNNNQAMKEDNGSNTRFEATVEIQGQNGNSSESIPVSAVEMEGINNEIENLYNMKTQKADGPVSIKVTDTSTGEQFVFNPESRRVEPLQAQIEPQPIEPVETKQESAGDLELKDDTLSMQIDDDNKIEKKFKTPEQAAVAKAGIESGKLGGDVLMSEDNNTPMSMQEFISHCKAFGNNWTAMILSGIKEVAPEYYNNIPDDKDISIDDALAMLDELNIGKNEQTAMGEATPTQDDINSLANDSKIYNQGVEEIDDGQQSDFEKVAASVRYIANKTNCSLEDAMDIYEKLTNYKFDKKDPAIEEAKNTYEDIEPGWYATIKGNVNYGLLGPYDSKEKLMAGMEDKADQLEIGYVSPEMLEALPMDEVIFKNPSEASDPFIEKPLNDCVNS